MQFWNCNGFVATFDVIKLFSPLLDDWISSRLGMAMQETWSYSTWFGKCSIHYAYSLQCFDFMIFSDLTLRFLLMYCSNLSAGVALNVWFTMNGNMREEQCCARTQGRTQGGGVGVKTPPWTWYFTKTLLPAQRRITVCAYFLLVNLSTYCKYHRINLHANFKKHCKRAKK